MSTAAARRARANAQAAVARALAHVKPPQPAARPEPAGEALGSQYPFVSPARARQIRQEIEEHRRA